MNQACVLVPQGPKFPVNASGRAEKDCQPQNKAATSIMTIANFVTTDGQNAKS